jgi:hypothetical protein
MNILPQTTMRKTCENAAGPPVTAGDRLKFVITAQHGWLIDNHGDARKPIVRSVGAENPYAAK